MSAYSSDQELGDVRDVTRGDVEVDVAANRLDGTVRLSILWTDEIVLSPDDAERVAHALLRAAGEGRRGTGGLRRRGGWVREGSGAGREESGVRAGRVVLWGLWLGCLLFAVWFFARVIALFVQAESW
ncbi:hypothetical protein [Actinacidiphila rubida]|uniref:hypothetical protein n=1 Tax=Actinacidiphila rubida TaxID=310780 RepID=UPI0015A73038|nr:hypothetical protein [Actinacidiphila rubida]